MSLDGFCEGAFPDGSWGVSGFSISGMNLNHWTNAVWAEGSWSAESWGGAEAPQPTETEISPSGGWLRRNHPFLRTPRSDDEEDDTAPQVVALTPALMPNPHQASVGGSVKPAVAVDARDASSEAYLDEYTRLMALEAIRKAKRRRSAETLLLLM